MPTPITPSSLGFRMPAEWHPHAATWAAWPFDPETWFSAQHLEEVRREHAALVLAIAESEPVHLLVSDAASESSARSWLGGHPQVFLHQLSLNDVWLRDTGPIFVTRDGPHGGASVAATEWSFNGWGGKFAADADNLISSAVVRWCDLPSYRAPWVFEGGSIDVNGAGWGLTTRQCLLHPNRNPHASPSELEQALHDFLGIQSVIWLEDGLEGDHTDGHIDTLARFTDTSTVICCKAADPDDVHHARLEENLSRLRAARGPQGEQLRVVELPLPSLKRQSLDGGPLPATYANFYITNRQVIVPTYQDPADSQALAILGELFPTRQVVGLSALAIVQGGGAFHCLTQQQPLAILSKETSP